MNESPLAQRYAEALSDSLQAADAQHREQARRELESFVAAVHDSFDLQNLLHNPSVAASDRLRVLETILDHMAASTPVRRFLGLLADRGRLDILDDTVRAFGELQDQREGRIRGHVVSARSLDPERQERLRKALERRTGRSIDLSFDVDPELIGGVRAQVGSIVFDGSLATGLSRLRERLET
ncbi:MAG: ATP synthase F1 subunit delta [Myxococcales bacterium]|nr:ATP synthase F1 subunit delta [Myxococcales bacterium]